MRRSLRNYEPFQIEENLLELIALMRTAVFPDGCSFSDFEKLLFAVQHHERKRDRISRSGRRKSFSDEFLSNASAAIKSVLFAETKGRISLLRFVSTFLPIIRYPPDIRAALNSQGINLAEARSLARINRKNFGDSGKDLVAVRRDLLDRHLRRMDTQSELARRVQEKLSNSSRAEAKRVTYEIMLLEERNEALLSVSEFDTEHLFWEEIKGLVFLVRGIDPSVVSDADTLEILSGLDSLKLKLLKLIGRGDRGSAGS